MWKSVVLLLLQNYVALDSISYTAFQAHLISDQSLPMIESLTDIKNKSISECSIACTQHEECRNFAHHKEKFDCLLYTEVYTLEFPSPHVGYNYFSAGEVTVRFKIYSGKINFDKARSLCQQEYQGRLACIHSAKDQQAINEAIKGVQGCTYFRIGLDRAVNKALYKWVDNTTIDSNKRADSYQNWSTNNPAHPDLPNLAIVVDVNGKWFDAGKDYGYCSICKLEL